MSFVHHVIEQHGCDYTIEDNENLNEKTQWHPWKWNPSPS
jgi:hypothetical protein